MTDLFSVQVTIYGRVQGVYFRAFASNHARELGLTGHVRNLLDDKAVEVQAEGDRNKLERLISHFRVGPPGSRIDKIETNWSEYTGNYPDFQIRY